MDPTNSRSPGPPRQHDPDVRALGQPVGHNRPHLSRPLLYRRARARVDRDQALTRIVALGREPVGNPGVVGFCDLIAHRSQVGSDTRRDAASKVAFCSHLVAIGPVRERLRQERPCFGPVVADALRDAGRGRQPRAPPVIEPQDHGSVVVRSAQRARRP